MALFGKQKKTTLDELLEAIATLSEDEQKKLHETLGAHIDESVAAQEVDSDTEDSQTAKDRIDEAVGEEAYEEEKKGETEAVEEEQEAEEVEAEVPHDEKAEQDAEHNQNEVIEALEARLMAVEAKLNEFAEMLSDIADMESTEVGASATANIEQEVDDLSEDDRIMQRYNPSWRRG